MSKKRFVKLLLIGIIPFLLILPIFNYKIDRWRVLHDDFTTSYDGLPINKNYLKVSYLIRNPNKYDTIMMGSSRNASLKGSLISPRAYNAYYEFGTIKGHLKNLKTLLRHNVKFKNLWIGINDFDIWKDSKDFEKDYSRTPYPSNYIEWINFYYLYLFKKPDITDIKLLKGEIPLVYSNRIFRKDLTEHFKSLENSELKNIKNSFKWRKKMTSMAGSLLGYKDDNYRIDKAINEINEIRELCNKHHIKLTLFFYPSFYKTYLLYNQYKIEEFKRKIVENGSFYDFYMLDKNVSLNELKWHDSSHFVLSEGIDIIKSIQNNKNLVNSKNIDIHIKNLRKKINNLLDKKIVTDYIMPFNYNISLESLKKIFTIKNLQKVPLHQCKIISNSKYNLKATGNDCKFILPSLKVNSRNIIMSFSIESSNKAFFQIFYKTNSKERYSESNSFTKYLHKGINSFNLLIPKKYITNELRIDMVNKKGNYKVFNINFYAK